MLKTHSCLALLATQLLALALFAVAQPSRFTHPSRLGVHRSTSPNTLISLPRIPEADAARPQVGFTFGRIDFPHSPSGTAYGLNGKGDSVGVWGPQSPIGYFGSFGYVLKDNKFSDFNYPGAVASGPFGINSRRQIVGYYDPTGNEDFHAYLYKGMKFVNIDPPGSTGGAALAINDPGEIVGTYYDTADVQHGFILKKGAYTTIDPASSFDSEPLSLNSAGTVVGDYYDIATQHLHGFIYQNGQFTTVDYPGATDTILTGINDAGQIVGGFGSNVVVGGFDWRTPNMFLLDQGQYIPLTLPVDNAYVTLSYGFKGNSVVGFYVDSLANLYGYEIQLSGAQ